MTDVSLAVGNATLERERAREQWRQRTARALLYIFLTALVFVYSLPGLGVILTSFKTNAEISRGGLWSMPGELRFTNYEEAWVEGNVRTYTVNSFLVGGQTYHRG